MFKRVFEEIRRSFIVEPPKNAIPSDPSAFTEYVAARMREQTATPVKVTEPLRIRAGNWEANLDRIYEFCRRGASAADAEREIRDFATKFVQMDAEKMGLQSKDDLRVIVRTRERILFEMRAADEHGHRLHTRPVCGELSAVVAMDTPISIAILTSRETEAIGLTIEDAFEVGLANMRKDLPPLESVFRALPIGEMGQSPPDIYLPSLLALHDAWARLAEAQGGKLLVSVPTTDTLIYIADDSSGGVRAMHTLTESFFAKSPNPLSKQVMRWTPQAWTLVD